MKSFTSRSQAGQDLFVKALLIDPSGQPPYRGRFLDIGANHPIELSNTYALEQLGWAGVLMDNDPNCVALLEQHRKSTVVRADGTTFNFRGLLPTLLAGHVIDYLSLDVDAATADTLDNLLQAPFRYRVATIEHDAYRFGTGPRDRIRAAMRRQGYDLLCEDVMNGGCAFEDWWIEPALVHREAAEYYRCSGKEGKLIAGDPAA